MYLVNHLFQTMNTAPTAMINPSSNMCIVVVRADHLNRLCVLLGALYGN